MRPAYALVACLVLAAPGLAQPSILLGEVTTESVPLYAGPNDRFPDTGTLFRGAKVYVAHDEGTDWFAIEPPPGQLSWIRSVNIEPIGGEEARQKSRWNAWVRAEPTAEVAYGLPGFDKPLEVRRTKLPEGSIVTVVGKAIQHNGVLWFPIAAPYGDFRYVPKSAVRVVRNTPAQQFVVKSPQPDPSEPKAGFEPASASLPNKGGAGTNHPLWIQAERAERDGDYAQAEALYLKLAAEMNQPGGDVTVANLCYSRIHAVREKRRQSDRGGSTVPPVEPAKRDANSGEKWVGPGVLRPAGFRLDNKATYALVSARGEVKCYAVAGPSVDLERFRGFDVELYGAMTYPGDLRGVGAMTVTRIQPSR